MRFPGFEGEWKTKKLGEIGEIVNGLTYSPNDIAENGVLVLRSSNIQNRSLAFEDNVYVRTENFNPVQENDILICVRNGSKNLIGKNALINKKNEGVAFGAFMSIYRSTFNRFLFHWFDTNEYKEIVHKNLGATINSINGSDLRKFKVPFPSVEEQQKMASFLSLVDERIQTQNKIIKNQETLMLGVLTKLFNQKLKSDSKELPLFPLWEYKKGGDIFYNCSNKKHNSDLPILAITQEYGAVPRDLIDHNITVTEKSIDSYKVVDKGDFIISLRSFQGGIEYSNYHGICSPAYIVLKSSINIVPEFYKYYLKSVAYIKLLNKKLEGIRDGKMISYNYFSEINLPYPCLEEQKYIADILTTIDNKIKIEKQILNSLSKQKDYLLQQMFI